ARVLTCIEHVPANLNLYMIVAANYRVLGRYEDAIAMYRAALRYDRRPELYLNIGECYLALGNTEEAQRYLVATALFRIDIFQNVPDAPKQRAWEEAFRRMKEPETAPYVLPE
ncbi:MAG TPA: tetratricopeptide repeat protein, partial [Thermoanaerobaculia bacterium]|nr:tetratricopeptide repeat protein [Thermoanaerobaculia bacterium]